MQSLALAVWPLVADFGHDQSVQLVRQLLIGKLLLPSLGEKAILPMAVKARIGEHDGVSPPLGMTSLSLVLREGAKKPSKLNLLGTHSWM